MWSPATTRVGAPSATRSATTASGGRRTIRAPRRRSVEQAPRGGDLVLLDERRAGAQSLGAIEGAGHRATDPEDVDAVEEMVEDPDLRGDLGAADDGDDGGARTVHHPAEHLELARHQLAGHRGKQMGDTLGRGVGAVRGARRRR